MMSNGTAQPQWNRLLQIAREEVARLLRRIPKELLERANSVPVRFESYPVPDNPGDPIDSDTLGIFEGNPLAEGEGPFPPEIVLFLENLWDAALDDDPGDTEAAFRREIRVTYLHELGHYLGLDEDDLLDRGL
jgi:predicted Zn-dependent protease with MMP-like domain